MADTGPAAVTYRIPFLPPKTAALRVIGSVASCCAGMIKLFACGPWLPKLFPHTNAPASGEADYPLIGVDPAKGACWGGHVKTGATP